MGRIMRLTPKTTLSDALCFPYLSGGLMVLAVELTMIALVISVVAVVSIVFLLACLIAVTRESIPSHERSLPQTLLLRSIG
jgi:uncharacterized membrane protein YozB (DUF420 family)